MKMQGIPIQQRALIRFVINRLKGETAPTSIGYNDMAVMIAYGQSREYGIPTVSADMISRFLTRNPGHMSIPADARMQPPMVQGYLEVLAKNNLINSEPKQGDYRMRDDISTILVDDTNYMKSPHIDEFLFHGFRLYSVEEIQREKEKRANEKEITASEEMVNNMLNPFRKKELEASIRGSQI